MAESCRADILEAFCPLAGESVALGLLLLPGVESINSSVATFVCLRMGGGRGGNSGLLSSMRASGMNSSWNSSWSSWSRRLSGKLPSSF